MQFLHHSPGTQNFTPMKPTFHPEVKFRFTPTVSLQVQKILSAAFSATCEHFTPPQNWPHD
jgi:hypothetical protein